MHGRLKVRSTEEELVRKKKEQALKVKAYRAAMSRIHSKRLKQELDDEMLTLAAKILLRNPDIATLWNIRRECILHKTEALLDDTEAQQRLFDADLALTEQCLMVNPKSYAAWHQRCWVLENCPHANWERELQLCNRYLKLDERNFHTWDYRRYVASRADASKQQELDYCTEMIRTNFSNYSSWHYRSQLLPALFPSQVDDCAADRPTMTEDKLREELAMVLTAAFTDPNDSSAWFYQRWLLGSSQSALDVCAFRINSKQALLAVTKPINRQDFEVRLCGGRWTLELQCWRPLHRTTIDTIWVAAITDVTEAELKSAASNGSLDLDVRLLGAASNKQLHLVACSDGLCYFKPPNFSLAFSSSVLINEMQNQLESCISLLEYEPDSKWTLLTSALLMRAIDRQRYNQQSLEYLQQLQKVDPLREGYFKDLASKWTMEILLEDWHKSNDFPNKLNLMGITRLMTIYDSYLCIADAIQLPDELKRVGKQLPTFATIQLDSLIKSK